ncbi:MAG: hypothetical protein K6G01_07515 [Eubacterium sp.]|nr:hypothetical protein [Eubacterium sp.]
MMDIRKTALLLGALAVFATSGCSSVAQAESDISVTEQEAVQDKSAQIRESASAGSLEEFSGKYQVQDAEGVYYYFDEDGTCYYVQSGTYEFEEDGTNVDGETADLLLMTLDTMETASQYTITTQDDETILTTTQTGAESETQMNLSCIEGTDGLAKLTPFEGIYMAYGEEAYRYEFHQDGSCYLIMEQSYEVEDDQITLEALGVSYTYDYETSDDTIVLSSEDATVAILVPTE